MRTGFWGADNDEIYLDILRLDEKELKGFKRTPCYLKRGKNDGGEGKSIL